ncbi:peptidoglycan-binding domain-containing protein [Streptacidiphilus cavernicola]|uniref:Peptidoglycan-binding protein n=1 Tax=Streptacidiphilus cavernicola TaxID=3342716 RepID=A0ABV6W0A6_9ACTN
MFKAFKAVLVGGAAAATVLVATPSAWATPAPISYHSTSCPNSLTYNEDDGCVVYLQQMLNTLGFGLSVDGQFGANTLSAVKWTQTKAHLQDSSVGVDGQVGPVTKGWIDKFYAQSSRQPGPSNACSIVLNPSPTSGAGGASATIAQINNSATCTGWLERYSNGSWSQVSGQHTIGGPGQWVTTYVYADTSTELARACVHYVGSGVSGTTCTIGF